MCETERTSDNTVFTESKWHKELGTALSKDCWQKICKMTKNKLVDNRVKWLQIQINHYALPTNYSVSKYKATQSPWCSFCNDHSHLERLSFLLWDCPKVLQFWTMVFAFLSNFMPQVGLGKNEALFGDINDKPESMVNTILVLSRMFIWRQKFSTKRLDDANYFRFLRYELLSISFILQKEMHSECIPLS